MAMTRTTSSFLLVCFNLLLLTFDLVKGARLISQAEDLEIERQLKVLNKPAIKTIHTEWGDIVDCVDIYKQPAFDHPLLKDHKIQLKPNFPNKKGTSHSHNSGRQSSVFKKLNEQCPRGTVPIRRITKDELIRSISFSKRESKVNSIYAGESMAGLSLTHPGVIYDAASANISLYNPIVAPDQFSSAEVAVENGDNEQTNSIRFGWMVNPQLYKSNETRFFLRWTADNFKNTGCYDHNCPGWVQISQRVYPGIQFDRLSVYGGERRLAFGLVFQDPKSGNWWFVAEDTEVVGYWDNRVFTHLNSGATRIFWGGHVKAGADQVSPPMGSGHRPNGIGGRKAEEESIFDDITYSTTTMEDREAPPESDIVKVNECPSNYGVAKYGADRLYGFSFGFGGGSGKCT